MAVRAHCTCVGEGGPCSLADSGAERGDDFTHIERRAIGQAVNERRVPRLQPLQSPPLHCHMPTQFPAGGAHPCGHALIVHLERLLGHLHQAHTKWVGEHRAIGSISAGRNCGRRARLAGKRDNEDGVRATRSPRISQCAHLLDSSCTAVHSHLRKGRVLCGDIECRTRNFHVGTSTGALRCPGLAATEPAIHTNAFCRGSNVRMAMCRVPSSSAVSAAYSATKLDASLCQFTCGANRSAVSRTKRISSSACLSTCQHADDSASASPGADVKTSLCVSESPANTPLASSTARSSSAPASLSASRAAGGESDGLRRAAGFFANGETYGHSWRESAPLGGGLQWAQAVACASKPKRVSISRCAAFTSRRKSCCIAPSPSNTLVSTRSLSLCSAVNFFLLLPLAPPLTQSPSRPLSVSDP
eukprot:scaffold26835_cov31-Tisochrysis_lutea.AAC.1